MNRSLAGLARHIVRWQRWESPLGGLLLARTELGLAGVWFDGQKDHPGELDPTRRGDDPLLSSTITLLAAYFSGEPVRFTQPLDLHGTAFQRAVWEQLLQIGAGRTCSYRDIACAVGSPSAVRAVGGAIGRNPVSVIVPCHRVVGSSGALTGYAGGITRKKFLLDLEHAVPAERDHRPRLDEAA